MANAAIELSRSNRASFKKRAITKYKSVDKKKLLKRAAIVGGSVAAVGAGYGLAKAHGMTPEQRQKVRKTIGGAASSAKFSGMRAGVKAKKAAMRFQGSKGHSWGDKGAAAMKAAKSRKRSITATKVMHPKHWRRYVKAEGFDFTRDDLVEAIVEELLSR